ncbi:MAG: asparagine synthase (glutamine-hydrolyzing) [Thermoleophilaceae bacterium]|jgi:asparagine synthase (glutamine-hydrolysing)
MCGIAGTLATDGPVEPGLVERMCESLDHRGPDSRGVFAEDGVALGVARLAVIDVEGGDQPLRNEDGSVVVVCNGEIYNYRELRDELIRRGHRFSSRSDTEVIAHLYEELGEGCVERLRGMFALAIWDRRARRLLLARDRVGKKPLFYAERAGRLWFASEPRAILASEAVPREVDQEAIDLFLHYQVVPAPRSAFAAIRKLEPAHTLTWSDGLVSTRRYWKLSYRDGDAIPDEREACERIREALLEATRLRLRSDVPVGALLSGGVDSSSVVAAMARLSGKPVKTFSIGFDDGAFDESSYAREVARHYGTDHHELILDAGAMELLPRLAWHYGEPFADSSALATFALAEHARRHVTVALNGDGGDETFCGYARHARPLPTRPLELHYAERRAHQYFDEAARADLYTREWADGLRGHDWRAVVEGPYFDSDSSDPVERVVDVDVQTYLSEDLLVKMDIAAMAHSLEARSPYCDHVLMELAAALPMSMKVKGEAPKALLKQAVRPWLPERTVDRPKMGFMIPMDRWLGQSLAAEVLLDPGTLDRGLFRPERLEALVAEHRDGSGDHGYRIWTLVMLELWFRTYVDRTPAQRPLELSIA